MIVICRYKIRGRASLASLRPYASCLLSSYVRGVDRAEVPVKFQPAQRAQIRPHAPECLLRCST